MAFDSDATNLEAGDSNGIRDVFVRTASAGLLERVSVATTGGQSNGSSGEAVITGDGSRVAFDSEATNLTPADGNTHRDAFVRHLTGGVTTLVSARTGVSVNGGSFDPMLADNGIVAFASDASNLVPGDTNGDADVFGSGQVCDGRLVTVDLTLPTGQEAGGPAPGQPTEGADVILGTPGPDVVNGLGGADRFCGLGGNDSFSGDAGNDRAFGGKGADTLRGQAGADRLDGGGGKDRLLGGDQADTLLGGAGNDTLEGGNGNDHLNGGTQRDTCKGQPGRDTATACEVRAGVP